MTDRIALLERLLTAIKEWAADPSSVKWRPVQQVINELGKAEETKG